MVPSPDAVDIDHGPFRQVSNTGADLTIDDESGNRLPISNTDSLLIIAGCRANDSVNASTIDVELTGEGVDPLDVVRIGETFGGYGGGGVGYTLSAWKVDNKSIETNESAYDLVEVDFTPPPNKEIDATWAIAFILGDQNQIDMIRLGEWETLMSGDTTDHDHPDIFNLDPNSLIVSAFIWDEGIAETDLNLFFWGPNTGFKTEWYESTTIDHANECGMFVVSSNPESIGTFSPGGTTWSNGGDDQCKAMAITVVIRNAANLERQTAAGDLGNLTKYWLEGVQGNDALQDSDQFTEDPTKIGKDRNDIGGFGSNLTTGKAVYLPGWVCDGKDNSGYKLLTAKTTQSLGQNEINIASFRPTNENREELWQKYIKGVKEDLELVDDDGKILEHIEWSSFNGIVMWDLETHALGYDGARKRGVGDGTNWGGAGAFKVDDDTIPLLEWEYNAACEYYWERLHQWFIHEFIPGENGDSTKVWLMQYHIPQGPLMGEADTTDEWGGYSWCNNDMRWLYEMQGTFDGHVYPPVQLVDNLGDDDDNGPLEIFIRNLANYFENDLQGVSKPASGMFCYLSFWPIRPNGSAMNTKTSMTREVAVLKELRTLDNWTDFNPIMNAPLSLGWNDRKEWDIEDVSGAHVVRIPEGGDPNGSRMKYQFDYQDNVIKIEESTENNGVWTLDYDEYEWPGPHEFQGDYWVDITKAGFVPWDPDDDTGILIRPAKTWSDFTRWWSDFKDALTDGL